MLLLEHSTQSITSFDIRPAGQVPSVTDVRLVLEQLINKLNKLG